MTDITVPDLTVSVYDSTNKIHLGDLPTARAERCQILPNDAGGTAEITANLTETAEVALLVPGNVARVAYRGTDVFAMPIRGRERIRISPTEEAGQVCTVKGEGLLIEWDRPYVGLHPLVGPYGRNATKRLLGDWTDPDYDASGAEWGDLSITALSIFLNSPPKAYPWPFTSRCWSDTGMLPRFLGRIPFTPAADCALFISLSCDDGAICTLNGMKIGETDQPVGFEQIPTAYAWDRTWRFVPAVEGGVEQILSLEGIDGGGAGRWIACTVFQLPDISTDEINTSTFLLHTGYQVGGVTLFPWRTMELNLTDPTPSMTDGKILRLMLEEFQAQGFLLDWTLGVDDTTDSLGNAWVAQGALIQDLGRSGLDFIRTMQASRADVWADPDGKVLQAAAWRTRATPGHTPPLFSAKVWATNPFRNPQITELRSVEQSPGESGQMLLRTKDGLSVVTGRRPYLDLGQLDAAPAATAVTADTATVAGVTTIMSIVPGQNADDEIAPGANWIGDELYVPDVDTPMSWVLEKLEAVTFVRTGEPRAQVVIETSSLLKNRQMENERTLERIRAGAVGSALLSAPQDLGTKIKSGVLTERQVTWNWSAELEVGPFDAERGPSDRRRWFRWAAEVTTPSADIVLDIILNGSVVFSGLTIPAGFTQADGFLGDVYWMDPDQAWIDITDPGGAAGLNFKILDTEGV